MPVDLILEVPTFFPLLTLLSQLRRMMQPRPLFWQQWQPTSGVTLARGSGTATLDLRHIFGNGANGATFTIRQLRRKCQLTKPRFRSQDASEWGLCALKHKGNAPHHTGLQLEWQVCWDVVTVLSRSSNGFIF